MTEQEITGILDKQRTYFRSGASLPYETRKQNLNAMRASLLRYEEKLNEALKTDLGKSGLESYFCEVGLTLAKLDWTIKHLRRLMRREHFMTPLVQFDARCFTSPSPYGNVLIISPWNYPVLLTLEPMVYALAAGNTVILKPSAYAPNVSEVIVEMIKETFPAELVTVVTGGRAENQSLLKQKFDLIFFTGGKNVGREVLRNAAEHLTPVVLELGGKSPCIVDATANVKLAARRIVFGKYLNCGQTCVAPDYVLCHTSVKEAFIEAVKAEITKQYGKEPLKNGNYGKMINQKHFDRVMGLIDSRKIVHGGMADVKALRIEPTVLDNVTPDDAVMQEEIFGPIMPVIGFDDINEVISFIEDRPHPLALYLFTTTRNVERKILDLCHFGGGCINDTIIHLATEMPFGGVGESGMGSYHGKAGFDTFTHRRSIVDKKNWIDLPVRYQPFNKLKEMMIRMFLK